MNNESHLQHFGLSAAPFLLSPDPEFLYLSTQHSLAQAYLSYALLNRDSFVVLLGETGTGKTTLINRLAATAGDRVAIARIGHSQLTPLELLQSILLCFGIRAFDKQKVELLTLLEQFIAEQQQARRQVLIVVDDAHNLGVDVLEEIRLVTELGAHRESAVNLILSGRPSLRETLELPVLEQLRQRMRFNFQLKALSGDETLEYINRRLDVAGATRTLFSPDCIDVVMHYTAGIPRLINILCDTALMSAFTEGASDVRPETLQLAIEELDWAPRAGEPEGRAAEQPFTEVARPPSGGDGATPTTASAGGFPGARESSTAARGPADGNGVAHAVFTMLVDDREVGRHELIGERLTIGRDRDNQIQIPAEYVSRHHAQVSWLRGGCWIADLNSTNGTFVNGKRVQRRLLHDGDEIQFGRHRLRVSCASPSAEAVEADGDEHWRQTLVLPERAGKA